GIALYLGVDDPATHAVACALDEAPHAANELIGNFGLGERPRQVEEKSQLAAFELRMHAPSPLRLQLLGQRCVEHSDEKEERQPYPNRRRNRLPAVDPQPVAVHTRGQGAGNGNLAESLTDRDEEDGKEIDEDQILRDAVPPGKTQKDQ